MLSATTKESLPRGPGLDAVVNELQRELPYPLQMESCESMFLRVEGSEANVDMEVLDTIPEIRHNSGGGCRMVVVIPYRFDGSDYEGSRYRGPEMVIETQIIYREADDVSLNIG